MLITLNISSLSIKLVTTVGNTVEKSQTSQLPPGLVKDGHILQPQPLAKIITTLFNSLQIPRDRVIASVTGMSFVYRMLKLPHLKPARLQEAVERATQKEINLPLEDLYIDWQVIDNKGDEVEIFVLGIPRILIDSIVHTMQLAKVRLIAVDLKALALARAIGEANALIVDLEPECFEIIVMSGGIPVIMHSVTPRNTYASVEDKVTQLADELTRTIDFYNLSHRDGLALAGTPLLLTGDLATDLSTSKLVLDTLGRTVKLPTTRFKVQADFPIPIYAGNLGLALKNNPRQKSGRPTDESYYDINLNPLCGRKRALGHPISVRKLLLHVSIIIAIILIISVSVLRNQAVSKTVGLQAELDRANRSLLLGRLTLTEANSTQAAINDFTGKTEALRKEREIISGRGNLSEILKFIAESLPVGTSTTGICAEAKQISIDGTSLSRAGIINYALALEKGGKFTEVRIASIDSTNNIGEDNQNGNISFQIVIER